MIDLDKQFAELADTSAEDSTCDFVIDEDLRVIAVPERGVVLGVEGDKDANRIRFRMNKTWRGYDMSKFDLRINYQNANGDKNYYTVTSKHTEGNAVVFDWIVAADAVAYQGDVFFIVVGLITTGGMVNCAFHTTLGKAKCLEGLVVDTKTDISEIRDFMATLKAEVEAYGQTFVNAAAASAKAAKASETTAASSASAAKTSETNSVTSAKVAKTSETNASTSASAAKTSETNAGTSAASAQANAKKAEAARDDANTSKTAAAGSAAAAKKDAQTASSAASTATGAASAAKTSETNAGTSASNAGTSASNAKGSETKSGEYLQATKEYFEQVRTITLGAQGWYETSDALTAAVPVGENGWWAVVGTTDSIWVWDRDTNAWRDSMVTVNMSDYYTRTQVDKKLTDKANKTADDLNTMINALTTDASTPTDADYYVSQYVGGGTSTTFHRRPMSMLWAYIKSKAESVFAAKNHAHSYAGSASAGDSATSAVKLDTAMAGSATKPVYFSGGKPVACTYELKKTVPADAVFTDHTYGAATASVLGLVKIGSNLTIASGLLSLTKANVTAALGYTPPTTNTTYDNATQRAAGLMSAADKKKLDGIGSDITASGTNYIRFSDGIQICWCFNDSNQSRWTFPVAFIDTSYIGFTADNSECIKLSPYDKKNTSCSIHMYSNSIAIGRWK